MLTNLPALKSVADEDVVVRVLPPASQRIAFVRALLSTWFRPAVVLVNSDHTTTLRACMWLRLVPRDRCKLVCADLNFNKPGTSLFSRLYVHLKRLLLLRVDVFLLLQKEYDGYTKYYGIDPARAVYLPWKVNLLPVIESLRPRDDGYVFAGGVTHRDWKTFGEAVRGLPVKCVVSIPNDEALRRAGQTALLPAEGTFGENVEVARHGPDPHEWLTLAAHARLAVMPISSDSLNPSGISTALSILALGKPLVITEGPTTTGILDAGRALIVPPANPIALRDAISRLMFDSSLRDQVSRAGKEYADACGGDQHLYSNILRAVVAAARGRDVTTIRLEPT